MTTAIVFGGAGFIGSHLLAALAASGSYSRLVSADITAPRFGVDGVEYVTCDVRKPIPADLVDFAPTEIYNFAAVHTTPGHEDWEYYWTNLHGATNVCRFASEKGTGTIVFTSSISVYGPSEEPKDEASELKPESAYGRSKLLAEGVHRLWRAERPAERRLVVVRPAVIYGRTERGNFTRLARLMRAGRFVYPGRRDTIKSCGYVEDLVASMAYMRDRGLPEITYNFAHQERFTSEDICRAFSKVAGYKPVTTTVPISVMLLAGFGMEVLNALGLKKSSINRARVMKLYQSTNVLPNELKKHGFPYRYTLEGSLARWKDTSKGEDFE
ncbi:NAD-dependent epimerase/dehydratase family protein [Chthonobacter rhizosphaerae]|uniref:NAD-dependent epimerase/dehydratase family protein n=1 Tax=Chthonobacter rhizosphaerae TaxID=2735553 RepID=UPI0015EE5AFB|nr:NAD(P)-dependent oxidoreductase [Chthonobacter rhizosphaerae]